MNDPPLFKFYLGMKTVYINNLKSEKQRSRKANMQGSWIKQKSKKRKSREAKSAKAEEQKSKEA